jgi:hypothetical protein
MSETEQATIESDTRRIKFTPAQEGFIAFNNSPSSFGDLFMLGAFAATKTIERGQEKPYFEYPTDHKGMEMLQNKSYEAITTLSDAVTSLGMMMAYVDRGEIGDAHLNTCAWLVTGLGELLSELVNENQEITNSILEISKQP